jgi:hypothetical protein
MSEKEKKPTEKPKNTRHTLEGFVEILDRLPGYKIVEDHSDYDSTFYITHTDPQNTHRISVDAKRTVFQECYLGRLVHITHQIEGDPLVTEIFLSPAEYSIKQFININGKRVPVDKEPDFETQTRQILEITKGALDIIDYSRHLTSRNPDRLLLMQYNGKNLREICDCLPDQEDPHCDPVFLGRLTINRALENEIPECEDVARIF